MTAVTEPTAPDVVIDLDLLTLEQLGELFDQLQARIPTPAADDQPTAIEALMRVMQEVQAIAKEGEYRETPKNGQSAGRVKYKFRGVDAVMKAVGPALRRHRLLPVPWVDDVRQHEIVTGGGTKMRETVTIITYRIYGPKGDFVETRIAGEAADSGDKSVSKSESVGYRMMWLQLLCIPTDEPDPDLTNYERGSVQGQAAEREVNQPSREQLLETVATTSTELRVLLGAGEYEWMDWIAKVCHKDFNVNVIKVQADGGPVEEIDLGKLRPNQLHILWNRLTGKLRQEKQKRAADAGMSERGA